MKKIFILLFVLMCIINILPYKVFIVSGSSMLPTYKNNQIIITKSKDYTIGKNDVITFNIENESYIKRVLGIPGDVVEITNDNVEINNIIVAPNSDKITPNHFVLKDNQYFVMGDNYYNSVDSMEFGPIEYSYISGKVIQ